ncbi:HAUS1 protein, partial [Halcyon senegalensis]|nr:HAUS1 protein [Halcyon senegalensis]
QVTLWLKTVYGNCPVPEYEVNAETVDVLYKLAEYSEARDRDMALLIEDMKERATECEANAKYLQGLLTEQPSLFLSSLSSECTRCLDILVSSAVLLETNNTSLTSLFSAINDRTWELYEVESENREKERELTKMKNKLTAALVMETQLQEDLKKWEEILKVQKAKCDIQSQNLIFLKNKAEDLKTRIKDAEEHLAAVGLNQSLTHESLMKLSE